MNYRHIYHAGNPCDVIKHITQALLLQRLAEKETPFCVLDTHAGLGLYDLDDPRARATCEADAGIRLFLEKADPALRALCQPYLDVCQSLNPSLEDGIRHYPGSPLIARRFLREKDRLFLCELHPEDVKPLRRLFRDDTQVQVHHRDGYEALRGLVPPQEKRGLVFIDPPFEQKGEFSVMAESLQGIARRWPGACVALWYPIKDRNDVWAFHEALVATGLPKLFYVEFLFTPEIRSDRLNGMGYVFWNAPWLFADKVQDVLAACSRVFLGGQSRTAILSEA